MGIKQALRVFVWVWVSGCSYWLLASGELEVESAAFEHYEADEVVEVAVAVADLDGGFDLVVDGLKSGVGQSEMVTVTSAFSTHR